MSDFGKTKTDIKVMEEFNSYIKEGLSSQEAFQAALTKTGKELKDVSKSAKDLMTGSRNAAVSISLYTKSTSSLGIAAKAASVGVKLLGSALNAVASYAIMSLISAGIQWIDDQIHALDLLEEKLDEAKAEYQANTQEVSNLESELASVNSQIESIQAKGKLEITDQEQLSLLEKQRASLETQLSIAKEIEKISLRGVAKKAQETISRSQYEKESSIDQQEPIRKAYLANQSQFKANIFNDVRDDRSDYADLVEPHEFKEATLSYDHLLEAYITAYRVSQEELKKEQDNLLKASREYELALQGTDKSAIKAAKKSLDTAQQSVDEWRSSQGEISEILSDEYTRLAGYLEGMERFTGDNLTAVEQYINSQFDQLDTIGLYLLEASGDTHWDETFNILKARYSEQLADLEDWFAQGNVISPLSIARFAPDLAHAFSEFGFDTGDIIHYLTQEFSSDSAEVEVPVEVELSPYETFTTSLFDASNASKVLNEALSEQNEAGSLSAETFKKLVDENADFADFLDRTASGYTLNIDAVNEYIAAQKALDKGLAISRIMELQELLADPTLSDETKSAYRTEITQLQMLIDELDLATGAYSRYAQAKATANQDAMYQTGTTMYSEYKDAYEQGKTGTDDFQTSVAFALGDDWESNYANKDEAYREALNKLKKYFGNEDERKNAISFMNELTNQGLLTDDGLVEGATLESIAAKLGTSQDLVRSLFGLLETYELGPEIDFDISEEDEQLAQKAEDIKILKDKSAALQAEIDSLKGQVESRTGEDGSSLTSTQIDEYSAKIAELEAQKAEIERMLNGNTRVDGWVLNGNGIDDAVGRAKAVKEIFDSLSSEGVEIPIILTGYWDELKEFLSFYHINPDNLSSAPTTTSESNTPSSTSIEPQLNTDSIAEQASEIEDDLVFEAQLEFQDGSTKNFDASSIAEPLQNASNALVEQAESTATASPEILAAASKIRTASDEVASAVQAFNSADSMTAEEMESATWNVVQSCSNLAIAYQDLQSLMGTTTTLPVTADTTAAQSAIADLEQTVTVTVKTVAVQENAKGTNYAKSGASLVDEEGAELIEHRRTGTYELGTNNGARFTQLEAGDVVHTAEETKKILSRKASFGGAFATGLSGMAGSLKKLESLLKSSSGSNSSSSNKTSSSSNSSSSSSSSSKKSSSKKKTSSSNVKKYLESLEKLFDWIEIRLERLQSITDKWVQSATEAIGYVAKNASLDNALANVSKQISESNKAYDKYMSKANEIADKLKLTSGTIKKIQEGTIDISSYSDSAKERIQTYQEWYEKAIQVKDALTELKEQQQEIAASKLENVINHYQWQIDRIDSALDYNASFVDLKGATGKEIFADDYLDSIDLTSEKIDRLNAERDALTSEFKNMVDAGYILEGSEQWYEYQGNLDELDVTILETSKDLQDLIDLSNQVILTNLQYALSALERSAAEVSNLMDLHESQGTDHSASDYESLIRNGMEQIQNLRDQNAELLKHQNGLDVMSEKYQELQDQINGNNDAIMDMMVSQEQWNDAVLDLRINEIQKYKDELAKVNDQYERQQALQQAIEDLERAKTQRTVKTYVEGEGWVYRADQSAVRDAQKAFDQAVHNETMNKLDDLIEAVESLKTDSNVYTSSGVLLGEEYTLPSFAGYAELMSSMGGTSIVSSAIEDAKKVAYEQVMGGIINSGASTSLSIGDIIVNGVDSPDALAEALLAEFPNAMLKAMHNKL